MDEPFLIINSMSLLPFGGWGSILGIQFSALFFLKVEKFQKKYTKFFFYFQNC